jgi:hypothetical protein
MSSSRKLEALQRKISESCIAIFARGIDFVLKGVIRRIISFDKVLAKAEKSCLTPIKFKSDC